MPRSISRTTALVAAVTGCVVLTLTPVAAGASTSPGEGAEPGCGRQLLTEPKRAAAVEANAPAKFATAAARNDETTADFAEVADDRTLWLDVCGLSFYVEPTLSEAGASGATAGVDNPGAVLPAGVDPFALESRPGSRRTIYLDFDGQTVTGTAWNTTAYPTIVAEPYSITAPADTNFTDAERTGIYRAWLTVAEDYAPFDVNVTTKDPGAAALARTDASDQVFGTRAVITAGGARKVECGCGGVAYVDVFDTTGATHDRYQPAWVYTDGSGTSGWNVGQVASHEVGHNFGLSHDGQTSSTGTLGYYRGTSSWAPIMGSAYHNLLSQWSQGSYAGATNTEDDLAIIAAGAPLVGDDHGDTAATATEVDVTTPVQGLITTRTDRDAFTFTAGGPTEFAAVAATPDTNLDLQLTVLDSTGAEIASVNPLVAGDEWEHPVPDGLLATWSANLPATPGTYTVLVDGSDNLGRVPGQPYDDYGSLGRYQVRLATAPGPATPTPPAPPVTSTPPAPITPPVSTTPPVATTPTVPVHIQTRRLPKGAVHRTYKATLALRTQAPGATWKVVRGSLPQGVKLKASSGGSAAKLTGTPRKKGTFRFTVEVAGSTGTTTRTFRIAIG